MEIKIDEQDVKALDRIQNSVKDLYIRLGQEVEQYEAIIEKFEKNREEIRARIKAEKDNYNNFLNTLGEKYELNSATRWNLDLDGKKFVSEEDEMEEENE